MKSSLFTQKSITSKVYFSLIELLIVIALLLIILTMVQPSLKRTMDFAHLTTCSQNYRGIHLAMTHYLNDFNYYPIACTNAEGNDRGNISWDDALAFGYDGRNMSVKVADARGAYGKGLDFLDLNLYNCPKDLRNNGRNDRHKRTYAINTNQHGKNMGGFSNFYRGGKRISTAFHDVPKPHQTVLLAETQSGYVSSQHKAGVMIVGEVLSLSATHLGDYNFLFADGHVEKLLAEETIDSEKGENSHYWTRNPND